MGYEAALVTLIVATPFAFATGYFDLRDMEIPHWLAGGTLAMFLIVVFATLPFGDALWRVAIAAGVLVAGFILFTANMLAGGDAKALATFALLVAPRDGSVALVLLAVFGVLTLAVIAILRRTALAGGDWKVWTAERRYPYGVALGAALVTYLALVVMISG